ncbi:5'-nucleotidase C-terminal domain-containing protein [Thermodesulfovibrio yellowstonii]|uniref:5'-nucleotidase C-terminal domain-containing protein n=1 Tax=Thermodesulfovibrio yellowstonii TaxID=28262 RepID=UPI003C7AC860
MKHFVKKSLITILFLILVFGVTKVSVSLDNSTTQNQLKITVLATSDEHGNVYPIDYYTLKSANRGLAKVYTLIKQARSENPNSILISNGDVIQGTPLTYYFTKIEKDTTHPMMLAMNYMGYDAMVVGNHEIQDYGFDWLMKVVGDAKFPILSANMVNTSTGQYPLKPYIIKEVNGVKIGIIGITTTETNTVTPSYNLKGHIFEDAVETAGKWVKFLRPQVDILIVSAHMGFEFGNDTKNFKYIEPLREGNVADAIVQKYPEIDILITGHDHYNIAPFIRNGVLCVQPSNWGQALAKLDITLEKSGDKWKIVKKEGVNLAVDDKVEAAPEILDLIKEYHEKAVKYVDSPIGEAVETIDGTLCRLQDNAMLDLIHKVQLDVTGADVSIAAMLPTVPPIFPKGEIKVRDIYSLYIYENTLWVKEVTGKDLKDALEWSYRYYNTYDFGKTDTPLVNPNIRAYNFDTVQGIEYEIDLTKPIGERVIKMTYKGKPVSMNQKFKLAVNNYRGNGGGGYTMLAKAPLIWKSDEEIRNLIIEYIKKEKYIKPEVDNNWKLYPTYLLDPLKNTIDTFFRNVKIDTYPYAVYDIDTSKKITKNHFLYLLSKSTEFTQAELKVDYGILTGYNTFFPELPVTKEEAVLLTVYTVGGLKEAQTVDTSILDKYEDGKDVSIWAKKAFSWAILKGIIKLVNNKLEPKKDLNLGEVIKLIVDARFPVITILHTNDFHGYISGTDAKNGGLARIYTIVKEERAKNPNTILIDAGDHIQGANIANFFKGQNVVEIYNAMGYNYATFGNHEFDWGKEVTKQRINEAKYTYLCANIIDTSTGKTFAPKAYDTMEFSTLKLGFYGLDTKELPILVNPVGIEGLKILDPIDTAKQMVETLKKDGSDFIITISHLGYNDGAGDDDKTLASTVSGINLIIGGHTHTVLKQADIVNGVYIVQTGEKGLNLGKIYLDFENTYSGSKLVNFRYTLVPITDAIKENADIKAMITPYEDKLKKEMDVVIGEALVDLDGERANVRSKETNLGNLVTDFMREISKTDIAITNGGGIRASIKKGPVKVGDVYNVLPFDNVIVKLELTGKDILDALENGFSQVEAGAGRFPQVSGLVVKVNKKNPPMKRVVEVLINGKPLDLNKIYTVATNDFMANGGDGYTAFKNAKSSLWPTGNWMRDDFVEYVKKHTPLNPQVEGRIVYVED